MKIIVLGGGFSDEQHSSRTSAKDVSEALMELGHTPYLLEYDSGFVGEIKRISPDAVFHTVQGKYHGDGAVQALLELIGIPYVGSRPPAAAIINNKTFCKKIWSSAGINTPVFFEYSRKEYINCGFEGFISKAKLNGLELPIVVKAPTQGSRFGMVFVKDIDSFKEVENTFQYDDVLLAERYVEGRFITQGIIEIEGELCVLPPVEIIDDCDAEFKLFYGEDLQHCIPDFTSEERKFIDKTTLESAKLVGASCYARLDYHLSGGELFLLEINAVPGLRRNYSDFLKCANAAGYDYLTTIDMILATAK